jgi:hypothetical protein
VKLEHGLRGVEHSAHLVPVDQVSEHCETHCLVFEQQKQETRNEVHALAVVQFGIADCVAGQYFAEIAAINPGHLSETPVNVDVDYVLDVSRQLDGLLTQVSKLFIVCIQVNLQDLDP